MRKSVDSKKVWKKIFNKFEKGDRVRVAPVYQVSNETEGEVVRVWKSTCYVKIFLKRSKGFYCYSIPIKHLELI